MVKIEYKGQLNNPKWRDNRWMAMALEPYHQLATGGMIDVKKYLTSLDAGKAAYDKAQELFNADIQKIKDAITTVNALLKTVTDPVEVANDENQLNLTELFTDNVAFPDYTAPSTAGPDTIISVVSGTIFYRQYADQFVPSTAIDPLDESETRTATPDQYFNADNTEENYKKLWWLPIEDSTDFNTVQIGLLNRTIYDLREDDPEYHTAGFVLPKTNYGLYPELLPQWSTLSDAQKNYIYQNFQTLSYPQRY
ncbi:MAG: hypothetical protein F6K55_03390 [Moorea sp. SIO4A3]|nr:hypothetical protein [Moorena sp. SIO4A3]